MSWCWVKVPTELELVSKLKQSAPNVYSVGSVNGLSLELSEYLLTVGQNFGLPSFPGQSREII